ncbi:hypothetical protein Tcur_2677 [Thermomonospora curvata DSM 43183]|uniref:Uncharacterized protein n=1 Tax=Thermomonospora curvata (strain ATCC 19995 / DSM 43183 / JCM 3096 / KCTC 9072 / NBRC 15933 / NCIMB 10081 / Henssen B9) TaxID=471852 RepID=D1A5T4_THECD|nr:hypothetical protein Tcur_2677 [Thermomonospora curvata DSM 43183]
MKSNEPWVAVRHQPDLAHTSDGGRSRELVMADRFN